jgi:hypothetical protein
MTEHTATITEHTTTPWRLIKDKPRRRFLIQENEGRNIASIFDRGWRAEADARFIVKACNERAELLEALENFMGCIASDGTKCAPNDSDFEFARSVLTKAQEETK